MKLEEMEELFEQYRDDYIKFDRVESKLSQRPDLHAFILLDKLVPGDSDMVSAAEHDEFWLSVAPEELAAVVTPEQVLELIRCGVRYDAHYDSLAFFA